MGDAEVEEGGGGGRAVEEGGRKRWGRGGGGGRKGGSGSGARAQDRSEAGGRGADCRQCSREPRRPGKSRSAAQVLQFLESPRGVGGGRRVALAPPSSPATAKPPSPTRPPGPAQRDAPRGRGGRGGRPRASGNSAPSDFRERGGFSAQNPPDSSDALCFHSGKLQ